MESNQVQLNYQSIKLFNNQLSIQSNQIQFNQIHSTQ